MRRFKLFILTACVVLTFTACDTGANEPATGTEVVTEIEPIAENETDSVAPTTKDNNSQADSTETSTSLENSDNNDETALADEKEVTTSTETETTLTPFEAHGKLSVEGTKLVDANGKPFQIKGVSTHGIAWFPQYVNADAFATIRNDWKANCIRIAMYSDENNGYCSGGNKDNLKKLVKDGVQYATDLGMYVIIDWHVLGEQDPNVHKDEAKLFFQEMSTLYKDYDNVLYEICNEPNGNVRWKNVKEYAEEVIPIIKNNNPDAVVIVGTPTWSQDVDMAAKLPITDYSNIMYAVHFYADTHKGDLRNKVKTALSKNLPVFCSEFGICDASGNGNCNEAEANTWIEFFNDNDISYCIWNLSNKNESSSLIKSSCSKTSGWTMDELSQEGKWYVGILGGNASSDTQPNTTDKTTTNNNTDNKNTDSGKPEQTETTSNSSGKLKASIDCSNSWNDGTYDFFQYNITINNTDKAYNATGWTVTVVFDGDVDIDQSWNGNYKKSGKNIVITPVDYNKTINMNSSLNDVGFIIKTNCGAKVTSVAVK